MLESKVYAAFAKAVKPVFEVERLENALQSGTFDCTLSAANRTIWVEFKQTAAEKLRGTQVGWVLRRDKRSCQTDMLVVTMDSRGFQIAMAVDMARNDLTIAEAPCILVSPSRVAEFLAVTFVLQPGEADDARRRYQQGISEDNGGDTRH